MKFKILLNSNVYKLTENISLKSLSNNSSLIKRKFRPCLSSRFQLRKFSTSSNQNNKPTEEKLSFFKKAKMKIKEYGTKGLLFYCFMYIANGFMFYFLFKYKLIDSDKFLNKLNEYGIDKYVHIDEIRNYVGKNNLDIMCAVVLNEIFDIIRVPLVLMLIPKIFRKIK
jgi:hypothetical protein